MVKTYHLLYARYYSNEIETILFYKEIEAQESSLISWKWPDRDANPDNLVLLFKRTLSSMLDEENAMEKNKAGLKETWRW